jgi:hypothetical protein
METALRRLILTITFKYIVNGDHAKARKAAAHPKRKVTMLPWAQIFLATGGGEADLEGKHAASIVKLELHGDLANEDYIAKISV